MHDMDMLDENPFDEQCLHSHAGSIQWVPLLVFVLDFDKELGESRFMFLTQHAANCKIF